MNFIFCNFEKLEKKTLASTVEFSVVFEYSFYCDTYKIPVSQANVLFRFFKLEKIEIHDF